LLASGREALDHLWFEIVRHAVEAADVILDAASARALRRQKEPVERFCRKTRDLDPNSLLANSESDPVAAIGND
jgi:hypothetical protein